MSIRLDARASRGERRIDFDVSEETAGPELKGSRLAYFDENGRYAPTDVYDRAALRPGTRIGGPAIIEETDTTIIVPPGAIARIDRHRNVITDLSPVDTLE